MGTTSITWISVKSSVRLLWDAGSSSIIRISEQPHWGYTWYHQCTPQLWLRAAYDTFSHQQVRWGLAFRFIWASAREGESWKGRGRKKLIVKLMNGVLVERGKRAVYVLFVPVFCAQNYRVVTHKHVRVHAKKFLSVWRSNAIYLSIFLLPCLWCSTVIGCRRLSYETKLRETYIRFGHIVLWIKIAAQ